MMFSPNEDDRFWKKPHQKEWFRFSTPLRYIASLIVLVCLVIFAWRLISPTHQSYNRADLALIRADETPFKVKAEDQGVPSVKHQDKLVYERIRNDQKKNSIEHILPDPELPLAQTRETPSSVKMVKQYTPEDLDPDNHPSSAPEPIKDAPPALISIEDLIDGTPEKTPALETRENKGDIFIQLGSLKSSEIAESEWMRISKKHQDILEGFKPIIQKVDLGTERGVYYRLRAGPFESAEKAEKACASLKDRKVGCLVIP